MLALLPIMTGHRFKKLQEQGPQMWMEYMQVGDAVLMAGILN